MDTKTPEELKELLLDKEKDEWVIGGLMALYAQQTPDEQKSYQTVYDNKMGFNGVDAPILTDMANWYQRTGGLSKKQIAFIRRTIVKYVKQMATIGVTPMSNNGKKKPVEDIKPMKWAGMQDNKIVIKFSFPKGDNQFKETLEKVKSLDGRRFISDEKHWTAILSLISFEKLKEWGFDIGEKLQAWYDEETKPIQKIKLDLPEGLKLYPFQKTGVAYIESKNGRALVGDEPGLGKTIQALGWLRLHPELRPAVIICPASVKLNWERETKKWLPKESTNVIFGRGGNLPKVSIHIINYDILADRTETQVDPKTKKEKIIIIEQGRAAQLKKLDPKVMIVDEIHYIKDKRALRTQEVRSLGKDVPTIGLSGTPFLNKPAEGWTFLNLIRPDLFPYFKVYGNKYCGPVYNPWKGANDYDGASNIDELHQLLVKSTMIRRLKKDVLPDLPEKTISIIPVEIDNENEYYHEEGKNIDTSTPGAILAQMERLKQLAVKGKMKTITNWIDDFLASGEKLVVFCVHRNIVDQLKDHFGKKAVRLYGGDSLKHRQEAIDRFQTDDSVRLFVGNIKAAGEGITLTAASNTCFIELAWGPYAHSQAEDRVHRIGQKNAVTAYYLVAVNTIEEDIALLLDEKKKVLDMVHDGKEVEETELLTELLKRIKERREK